MRLIDADALDYTLGASDEDIYFHHMLEDAPTADAIPVEWLHKKREQMIDAAQNTPEQAIAYVLWMWQKEQEAR